MASPNAPPGGRREGGGEAGWRGSPSVGGVAFNRKQINRCWSYPPVAYEMACGMPPPLPSAQHRLTRSTCETLAGWVYRVTQGCHQKRVEGHGGGDT